MRIPERREERHALYRNIIRQCEVSRPERRTDSARNRRLYLTGAADGSRPRYNAIKPFVRSSASILYASGTTRFGVSLPPHYGDVFIEEEQAAREELHQLWHHASGAATVFGMGVTWAHVWPTAVFKVLVSENRPLLTLLPDPGDLGLLNEQKDDWDTQEAICQWYDLDLHSFQRMVDALPDQTLAARLMEQAEAHAETPQENGSDLLPPTVNKLVLAAASPNMIGAITGPEYRDRAAPRVNDHVVKMAELWIKDDALGDYRVVSNFLATEEILWDPQNPLNPGEHPFHDLCLSPIPGYAWGEAPIEDQEALAAWRESKMDQLDERDELQLNPPIVFENMNSLDGEKSKTFRKAGGNITLSSPGQKATPMVPQPLPDPFAFVQQIDQMSAKAGGLPRGLSGETEAGVRSGDQAMTQAMLGSGPSYERANAVVGCLEAVATQMLRLHRRILEQTIKKHDGKEFLLSQMPSDLTATVWAQSSSPLYAEKIVQKAMAAVQMKAISPEDALDYLDLPMTEQLKSTARRLAKSQAEMKQRQLEMKEREVEAKVIKANKP